MPRCPMLPLLPTFLLLLRSRSVGAIPATRFVDILNAPRLNRDELPGAEKRQGSDVEVRWIEQRLDHFETHPNEHPARTFRQRYFYSGRYVGQRRRRNRAGLRGENGASAAAAADDDEGPTDLVVPTYAFVCVGGEGPSLTESVLVDSVHCTGDMIELARRLHYSVSGNAANVHMFALEHRYYGESYPQFPNDESSPVSNENLVYLSSRQALADLAHFISTVKSDPLYVGHLTRANGDFAAAEDEDRVKFVCFGGSYPGMLAAWSRSKFPHLVHAAVSNSAPVQAQLDFAEYNDRVAYDLRDEDVGGSQECLDIFVDGHADIAGVLSSASDDGVADDELLGGAVDGRDHIARLFNVCAGPESLVDRRNVSAFLGDGVVYVPAQANDPSCSDDCIERLCTSLIEANSRLNSPMQSLAAISKRQRNGTCVDVNWDGTIEYLASPEAQAGGLRSWLWQTCTEFGFYQTCKASSSCPYGRGFHTLDLDLEICRRAFGVDAEEVAMNVRGTLDYYGGWDLEGSRILFTNGEVDPWAMLGVIDGHGRTTLPALWVEGASHHFWTHEVKDSDGRGIQHARNLIYGQVTDWIAVSPADGGNGEISVPDHNLEQQTAQV